MPANIDRLEKGAKPSLLDTAKGNELIFAINELSALVSTQESIIQDLLTRVEDLESRKRKDIVVRPPLYLRTRPDDTQEIIFSGYTRHLRYCGGAGYLLHLDDPYDVKKEYGVNF